MRGGGSGEGGLANRSSEPELELWLPTAAITQHKTIQQRGRSTAGRMRHADYSELFGFYLLRGNVTKHMISFWTVDEIKEAI